MSKFIKLHSATEEEIRISVDAIESYGTIKDDSYRNCGGYIGYTYIIYRGMSKDDIPYVVKEFPEEIDKIIEDAKRYRWLERLGCVTPGGDPAYECPVCHSKESVHINGIECMTHWNYCPNCGMRLEY